MGRVCYHPCETACNRVQLDEAVGINSVERFLGDEAIKRGWALRGADGAGRASASWWSAPDRRACRRPTTSRAWATRSSIRDAGPEAGGMMRYGIPRYRLPREILDAEIQRILDLGVEFECDSTVSDLERGHARRLLRRGLPRGRRPRRPADVDPRRRPRPTSSTPSRSCAAWRPTEPPQLGRRVVVYGGGNTAMDTARTAKRLGAQEAVVVYRRDRDRMPAHDFEVEEAEEEGVLDALAVDDQGGRRRPRGGRAHGARRDRLPAADRRARRARGRLGRARAGPGRRPRAARRRARDRGRRRRRPGRPEHDDRPRGDLRRRATWCPPSGR